MSERNAGLSHDFIERQRKRLETLRAELLQRNQRTHAEERALQDRYGNEPRDAGDDGADIARREINQGLRELGGRRLAEVERALQKIQEGSYGLSDSSGEPIPKERLESVPEAIFTVEDEERRAAR
jgi:DnaK suppressor protein